MAAALAVLLGVAGCAAPPPSVPDPPDPVDREFVPFVPDEAVPDHREFRLCDETASFDDPRAEKRDITCRFEGASFAPEMPAVEDLVVMTFNMERNYRLDAQIQAFLDADDELVLPDVILASEVDRGCARSGSRNGGREFAEALGYDYVFGVEFVEGVRSNLPTACEHGQAIFSRFPIGNVELFRHQSFGYDRYDSPTEPRIGSRADLEADILVGDRIVRVVSVHYDDKLEEAPGRVNQAKATSQNHLQENVPTVVGGDMNTALYFLDPSPLAVFSEGARTFWWSGWSDTHAGRPNRITVPFELLGVVFPAVVDLLWVRTVDRARVSDPQGCPVSRCGDLSDHLPQWMTLSLAR